MVSVTAGIDTAHEAVFIESAFNLSFILSVLLHGGSVFERLGGRTGQLMPCSFLVRDLTSTSERWRVHTNMEIERDIATPQQYDVKSQTEKRLPFPRWDMMAETT